MELEVIAKMMPVDIAHIESLHAVVRRLLVAKSVQTHSLTSADLSAQWLLMQLRRIASKRNAMRTSARGKHVRKKGCKPKRKPRKQTQKGGPKQRPGFGGAWRAMMRSRGRGIKPADAPIGEWARECQAAKKGQDA